VGRARVAGRVYRDVNENGRWDAGEGLVPNATLRVGSRGVTTDSSGRYTAWDLIPFEATSVELDTLSLPDPSWVPPTTLFQLAPSPNAYTSLDIPLVPGHELEGRVVAADGRHAVGGVTLLLRYIATGRTRRIVSFGDGSFYLLGLQAGEYEMTVSPTDLRGLQADASPIRFEIGRTGDRTPGVEVRLRPAINAAE
jgi:outer membrane usher protein FimD/PapC